MNSGSDRGVNGILVQFDRQSMAKIAQFRKFVELCKFCRFPALELSHIENEDCRKQSSF